MTVLSPSFFFKCWRRLGLSCLAAFALVACGGGGSDNPPVPAAQQPSSATFDVAAAMVARAKATGSLTATLAGQASGVPFSGSGTVSLTGSPAVFDGVNATRHTLSATGTISMNGQAFSLSLYGEEFFDSAYNLLGGISNGYYGMVTSRAALPTAAHVGDGGPYVQWTYYASSEKTIVVKTAAWTYRLEADGASADSALLSIEQTLFNSAATPEAKSTSVFRLTTAGAVTPVSDTTHDLTTGITYTLTYP